MAEFTAYNCQYQWIDSETVTSENAEELFADVSGILVPGGFGHRGIEGKIEAIRYARHPQYPVPWSLSRNAAFHCGIARDVIGYKDAHSMELNPDTTHPVIHIMEDQIGIEDIGGTLRLGSYPCVLKEDSLAYRLYGTKEIHERHRHRYEVNNDYREVLEANGMSLCGLLRTAGS